RHDPPGCFWMNAKRRMPAESGDSSIASTGYARRSTRLALREVWGMSTPRDFSTFRARRAALRLAPEPWSATAATAAALPAATQASIKLTAASPALVSAWHASSEPMWMVFSSNVWLAMGSFKSVATTSIPGWSLVQYGDGV